MFLEVGRLYVGNYQAVIETLTPLPDLAGVDGDREFAIFSIIPNLENAMDFTPSKIREACFRKTLIIIDGREILAWKYIGEYPEEC